MKANGHIASLYADLVARLMRQEAKHGKVIPWSCPVPAFGDLESARVATLGLNPSSREFMDEEGRELSEETRRLPTLSSLALRDWGDAEEEHIREIMRACSDYFDGNPYDLWFRALNDLLSEAGATFYGSDANACHVDLIPFATRPKWTGLSHDERAALFRLAGGVLVAILRVSAIRVLVLNGASVVRSFESLTGRALSVSEMSEWTLPRRSGEGVRGRAYSGDVTALDGMPLGRSVRVLGYNHNIQSSFGVTTSVKVAISRWLGEELVKAMK